MVGGSEPEGLQPLEQAEPAWERDRDRRTAKPSGARQLRRPAQAREVAAQLLRLTPPIVSITGKPGAGRTSLIDESDAVLQGTADHPVFVRISPESVEPARELRLEITRSSAGRSARVLVFDDLCGMTRLGTRGPDVEFLDDISLAHRRDRIGVLVTMDESQIERIADVHPELAASLHHVRLEELSREDLVEIGTEQAADLARRAGVALAPDVLELALGPPRSEDTRTHPGLAIERIDAAIGRARLHGAVTATADHLRGEHERVALIDETAAVNVVELARRLRQGVRGQNAAVDALAKRLVPAFAGLKLRAERPHGVFMFAGPSGVGKTELAKQLAREAYGSERALIRLDMSEYADRQDARVKLIGVHRAWKNSSTDGLLTTRVIHQPRSLLLLDEFEKAAPELWPLFLQVFDEGMLADAWGQTASFAETIIVLTSNLGAREGTARSAGFGAGEGFRSERQLQEITRELPPEFLNRISAVIPFAPLSAATIRELADLELTRAAERFADNGWQIRWDEDVVDRLAVIGYDPSYGARHLQRTIEQELLPLLAVSRGRVVRIVVSEDRLTIKHGR